MRPAIAVCTRRRSRRPSCSRGHVLSAILATLLLFEVCDGYMSTMHLGRTLKALRARELELQQQQQQQQEQGHGSLPPEVSTSPSPDHQTSAEEIQEGSEDRAAAPAVHDGPEIAARMAVAGTHPSWGGAPDDSTGGEPTDTQDEATASISAAFDEQGLDEESAGGADLAGEGIGVTEEQQEEEPGRKFNLSTSPGTAAAGVGTGGLASARHQTVDATARTARFPSESGREGGSKRHGSQSSRMDVAEEDMNEETTDETADSARVAVAGATGVLDEGSSSSSSSSSSTTVGHHSAATTAATEVEVGLEDVVGSSTSRYSTTAADFGVTAADAATPSQQQDNELEEGEEGEEEEDNEGVGYSEKVVEEEDVEAVAIREILSQRSVRDLEVQEAAARAVEALPATQRECFEEVKAFAFGGAGDGEIDGLSEEEVAALDTVAICGDRDGVVLAFLRHSKFDVRKAKESMRRCCAWRREYEANDIFKRAVSPAKMRKHRTHWPTGFHKEDRAGRPVFYDRVGQSDLTKLRADPDGLDQDEMVQIFTQNMEARRRFVLTRLSREAGHPVDQMTTVLDLTGLGMRHMSKEAVSYTRRISDVFQDNYSGMTCSLLILNAPWVFSKGWQIIEGFLSEDTVAKVKVLGKGDAGLAQLEKYIPQGNIPEFLGGESPAIIGPSDPLWADVDGAVRSWASGGDPFLDRAEVDRVSGRIRKERENALRATSKAEPRSKSKAQAQAPSRSEAKAREVLMGEEAEEERPLAPAAEQERALPAAGVDDGRRRARAKTSRRAASASAVAVAAGGRAKSCNKGARRSKGHRQTADLGKETPRLVREDRDRGKGEQRKKKHGRQRGGLASSSSSSATGRLSPSSSRRRTTSQSSLPSATNKTTLSRGAVGNAAGVAAAARAKGTSGRGSVLRGPAVQETLGSPHRGQVGGEKDGRGRRSHTSPKKKSVTWEDAQVEENEEQDEKEADDDGRAMAGGGGGTVGERLLEGFARGVMPVLRAWVSQLVAGLLAAGKMLMNAAERVLRFLRGALFEQVEVED